MNSTLFKHFYYNIYMIAVFLTVAFATKLYFVLLSLLYIDFNISSFIFSLVAYISYILNQKISNSAILIVLQNLTFFDMFIINPYYANFLYKL